MEEAVYILRKEGSIYICWEQTVEESILLRKANLLIDQLEEDGVSLIFAELPLVTAEMATLSKLGFELRSIRGETMIYALEL